MSLSPEKIKRLHAMLAMLDKMAYKIDYVIEVTKGRETSTKALSSEEYEDLIFRLQAEINKKGLNRPNNPEVNKTIRMRGKILSMCHEMQMQLPGSTKLDMHRVNALVLKIGYLKKAFNDYSNKELPTLITQFEKVLKSYYKKGLAE